MCDEDQKKNQFNLQKNMVYKICWGSVLESKNITAVVIAAPASIHAKLVKEALHANKHVFVEKPLALTYEEGLVLCKLASAKKRILMVGHLLHYHNAFLELKRIIERGELGTFSISIRTV